jgi:hypothetical protein
LLEMQGQCFNHALNHHWPQMAGCFAACCACCHDLRWTF